LILDSKNKIVRVHISIPLFVKELCKEAGEKLGISTSEVIALAAREYARDTIELPRVAPAVPVPTLSDVLRSYVEGTGDRLIGPCGEAWSQCQYEDSDPEIVGSMEFCGKCGVRTG
tara:strand:+ start:2354 stop:2701 length:348 start_codon:yes stop_codon:yes gene_type:complete